MAISVSTDKVSVSALKLLLRGWEGECSNHFQRVQIIDLLVLTKAVFALVWSFPFVESLINWIFSQSDNKSLHLCFQIIVFQILLHNYEKV